MKKRVKIIIGVSIAILLLIGLAIFSLSEMVLLTLPALNPMFLRKGPKSIRL